MEVKWNGHSVGAGKSEAPIKKKKKYPGLPLRARAHVNAKLPSALFD